MAYTPDEVKTDHSLFDTRFANCRRTSSLGHFTCLDWICFSTQIKQKCCLGINYHVRIALERWNMLTIPAIHGRPFVPFNNIHATPGNQNNGYCMHVSILFPTWHRLYLALYEVCLGSNDFRPDIQQQVMYGLIQDISNMYPKGATRDIVRDSGCDISNTILGLGCSSSWQ